MAGSIGWTLPDRHILLSGNTGPIPAVHAIPVRRHAPLLAEGRVERQTASLDNDEWRTEQRSVSTTLGSSLCPPM